MGGYKDFVTGEVLTASDVQDYLMDQSVMVFGGTAARGSAIASPTEGMVTYLSDSDTVEVYDGTSWSVVGGGAAVLSNTPTGTYSSGGTAYAYYEFTASGTATVTKAGFADVLVVGGGSGGGKFAVGGGGAGGVLQVTNAYLPAGSLTVTVGAGGAGQTGGTTASSEAILGSASRLDFLYGVAGGSGAGGSADSGAGASGVEGQGNSGGSGTTGLAGGGGGAGEAGNTDGAGQGGDGISSSITGSAVIYGGGGGGGRSGTSAGGIGGDGGGGTGGRSDNVAGTAGTANTGGGGGGGGQNSSSFIRSNSGAGGSGIVIIRVRT